MDSLEGKNIQSITNGPMNLSYEVMTKSNICQNIVAPMSAGFDTLKNEFSMFWSKSGLTLCL